ncbi:MULTISPECIES: hypothetical protein [unclassified Streptomyces]|nr:MULTISPECIES: hypothetical protein [unclassified Streptomyces]
MRTQTDYYFLRGMDGDKSDGSGGTGPGGHCQATRFPAARLYFRRLTT